MNTNFILKIIEIHFYNFVMKVCIHEKVVDRANLYKCWYKVCIGTASYEKDDFFISERPSDSWASLPRLQYNKRDILSGLKVNVYLLSDIEVQEGFQIRRLA
jgi:hypothetical protein